jgi:hypothetical protein
MSYILNIKVNNLIQLVNSLVINSVTNPLTSTIVGGGFNINNVNTVGLINIGDSTSTYSGTPNLVVGTVGQTLIKDKNNSLVWKSPNLSYIFYVDSLGSDVAGFGSISNPFKTIQYAISRCTSLSTSYTIYVASGSYTENIVLDVSVVSPNIEIIGMTMTSSAITQNVNDNNGVNVNGNITIQGGAGGSSNIISMSNMNISNPSLIQVLQAVGSNYNLFLNNLTLASTGTPSGSTPSVQISASSGVIPVYMNNCNIYNSSTSTSSLIDIENCIIQEMINCILTSSASVSQHIINVTDGAQIVYMYNTTLTNNGNHCINYTNNTGANASFPFKMVNCSITNTAGVLINLHRLYTDVLFSNNVLYSQRASDISGYIFVAVAPDPAIPSKTLTTTNNLFKNNKTTTSTFTPVATSGATSAYKRVTYNYNGDTFQNKFSGTNSIEYPDATDITNVFVAVTQLTTPTITTLSSNINGNNKNITNLDIIGATTGNMTTANITTGNITTGNITTLKTDTINSASATTGITFTGGETGSPSLNAFYWRFGSNTASMSLASNSLSVNTPLFVQSGNLQVNNPVNNFITELKTQATSTYTMKLPTGTTTTASSALISDVNGNLSYNDQALLTTSPATFTSLTTPTIQSSSTGGDNSSISIVAGNGSGGASGNVNIGISGTNNLLSVNKSAVSVNIPLKLVNNTNGSTTLLPAVASTSASVFFFPDGPATKATAIRIKANAQTGSFNQLDYNDQDLQTTSDVQFNNLKLTNGVGGSYTQIKTQASNNYILNLPSSTSTVGDAPIISDTVGNLSYNDQALLKSSNTIFASVRPTDIKDNIDSTGAVGQILRKTLSNTMQWATALQTTGQVFYVDSVNGSDDTGVGMGTSYYPYKTIAKAVSFCTTINLYYTIYIAPATYTETITVTAISITNMPRINFIGMSATNTVSNQGTTNSKGVIINGGFVVSGDGGAVNFTQNFISVNNLYIKSSGVGSSNVNLSGSGYSLFINNCYIENVGATVPLINAISSTSQSNNCVLYLSGCTITSGTPSYVGTNACIFLKGFNLAECNYCNITHSSTGGKGIQIENQTGASKGSFIQAIENTVMDIKFGSIAINYLSTTSVSLSGYIKNCDFSHFPSASASDAIISMTGSGGSSTTPLVLILRNNSFTNKATVNNNNPFIRLGTFCTVQAITNNYISLFGGISPVIQAFVPYIATGTNNTVIYSANVYSNNNNTGTNTVTYNSTGFSTMSALKNDIANGGGGGGVSSVTNGTTYASGYLASIAGSTITINTPNQSVNTNGTPSFTSLTTPDIFSSSTYTSDNSSLEIFTGSGGLYMNAGGSTPYTFVNGGNGTLATLSTGGFELKQGSVSVKNGSNAFISINNNSTATNTGSFAFYTPSSGLYGYLTGSGTGINIYSENNNRLSYSNGGLVFETANTGLKFNNSNSGVITNSLLNDYETGTFITGWFNLGGTSPSTYPTTIRYTKVGTLVTWQYTFFNNGTTGTTIICNAGQTFFLLPFKPAVVGSSGGAFNWCNSASSSFGSGFHFRGGPGNAGTAFPTSFTTTAGQAGIEFTGSYIAEF